MELIKRFVTWTAWEMVTPKAYGWFHILFFVIGFVLSIVLAIVLKKLNQKKVSWILFWCGVFLIIIEIYKQFFYYFVIGNGSYEWWIFPFQLCSVPMYLCLVLPFIKNGKVKSAIFNFLLAINFFSGFVAFLEPSGLLHSYYTLTFHSFSWHMMLIFIGLLIWSTNNGCNKMKDYVRALPVFGIVVVIAEAINILLRNKPGVNMFFISPYNTSSIIVFKTINERFGWYVSAPLFILSILLGTYIFYLIFYFIKTRIKRRVEIKNKSAIV